MDSVMSGLEEWRCCPRCGHDYVYIHGRLELCNDCQSSEAPRSPFEGADMKVIEWPTLS